MPNHIFNLGNLIKQAKIRIFLPSIGLENREIKRKITTNLAVLALGLTLFSQCEIDRTMSPETVLNEKEPATAPEVVLRKRFHPLLLEDGHLMGLFLDTLGGDRSGIRSLISKDNGRSWGDPQILYVLPEASENDAWLDLVPVLDKDNRLQVFFLKWRGKDMKWYGEDRENKHLDVWHARSEFPWNTWEEPKRVFAGYVGALMSAIQMKNGRILTSFAFRTDRNFRKPGRGLAGYVFMGEHSCTSIFSDDDGKTFGQSPDTLSLPSGTLDHPLGAAEPVMIELGDGRVWMIIRTQLGRHYESFSPDGIKWSRPEPTMFMASDSPASLTRLMDNQIVILWNGCQRYNYGGGRFALHGAISSDEGKSWQGFREVYRDPHRKEPALPIRRDFGTAYSFCTPTANGKMVFSTGQGNSQMTFLVDPEWLHVNRQFEDFSQGLEAWSVFGTRGVALVNHPDVEGAQVLRIQRTDLEFPAGAVWNFPGGKKGEVRMRILLEEQSGSFSLSLTDHFSTPFDQESDLYSLFLVPINSDDQGLTERAKWEPGTWHDITVKWDFERNQGQIVIDGKEIKVIRQLRSVSQGVNYLRIRSSEKYLQQGGLLLESVQSVIE